MTSPNDKPDYHTHEEFLNRKTKLAEIKELGIDPYPHTFTPLHHTQELQNRYGPSFTSTSEEAEAGTTPTATLAGRLVLFRSMGKNAFAQIQDEEGRLQLMFNRERTEVSGFKPREELSSLKFIEKKLDLGDIIGVEGNLFRTHKGELTLYVKKLTVLCKSLLPLPDKHSGLADKGVRYRKRWLDLLTHSESVETLKLRSRIVRLIREALHEAGFMEVETPILQNVYGGAQARPFETKLHALDQEMFLRISLEIPLKKLLVGGLGKVFELSKVFRNEGIDRTHNPEFTELEAYAAYWDYNDTMRFVETLYERLALNLFGTTVLQRAGHEIDLKAPWKRLTMKEAIKVYGGVDIDALSDAEMKEMLLSLEGYEAKKVSALPRGLLIAHLFEELAEKHLIQPHHITDHPIETTPLCKLHRDPEARAEGIVERFESFILGGEICNAYTELNDPELQRELLVKQAEARLAGDEEASPLDEEFIEAIAQGMPPASGIGIGIDRLVMLFTGVESIRDVLYFPLMRSEE